MSSGYAITNALTGLAATAFTWSSGYTTDRAKLNDGLQDEVAAGSSSAQASGQTLKVDLGAATALVGVAILNHNLASGSCTVQIDASSDDFAADTTAVKAATTINTSAPYDKDTVLQFPSVTKRYWRFTFVHTGTKTVRLGELLFFASITTLTRQSVYGAGEEERFPQNRVASDTGHVRATVLAGAIRSKSLDFRDLRLTTERDEVMAMWRATQGGAKTLLFIDLIESQATAASSAGQQCLWGKLEPVQGWTEDDYQVFTTTALRLTGLGREAGT